MDTSSGNSSTTPQQKGDNKTDNKDEAMDVTESSASVKGQSKGKSAEDDDDVVIMKEENAGWSAQQAALENISKIIDDAKDMVKMTDEEIAVMKQELVAMQVGFIYLFKIDLEINVMITSKTDTKYDKKRPNKK